MAGTLVEHRASVCSSHLCLSRTKCRGVTFWAHSSPGTTAAWVCSNILHFTSHSNSELSHKILRVISKTSWGIQVQSYKCHRFLWWKVQALGCLTWEKESCADRHQGTYPLARNRGNIYEAASDEGLRKTNLWQKLLKIPICDDWKVASSSKQKRTEKKTTSALTGLWPQHVKGGVFSRCLDIFLTQIQKGLGALQTVAFPRGLWRVRFISVKPMWDKALKRLNRSWWIQWNKSGVARSITQSPQTFSSPCSKMRTKQPYGILLSAEVFTLVGCTELFVSFDWAPPELWQILSGQIWPCELNRSEQYLLSSQVQERLLISYWSNTLIGFNSMKIIGTATTRYLRFEVFPQTLRNMCIHVLEHTRMCVFVCMFAQHLCACFWENTFQLLCKVRLVKYFFRESSQGGLSPWTPGSVAAFDSQWAWRKSINDDEAGVSHKTNSRRSFLGLGRVWCRVRPIRVTTWLTTNVSCVRRDISTCILLTHAVSFSRSQDHRTIYLTWSLQVVRTVSTCSIV